jgi:hypothetical protein
MGGFLKLLFFILYLPFQIRMDQLWVQNDYEEWKKNQRP